MEDVLDIEGGVVDHLDGGLSRGAAGFDKRNARFSRASRDRFRLGMVTDDDDDGSFFSAETNVMPCPRAWSAAKAGMIELTPPELAATATMPIIRPANAPLPGTDSTDVPAMIPQPTMPARELARITVYFPETLSQMTDATTGVT